MSIISLYLFLSLFVTQRFGLICNDFTYISECVHSSNLFEFQIQNILVFTSQYENNERIPF